MDAIEKGQLVIYTAYALIGLGTFIVARMLVQEQESRAAQDNLAELGNRDASNFLVKITRPFFTQYVVPMLRGKLFWESRRVHYKRKLVAAGLREELTPDEMIAFKLFLILFFPIVLGLLKVGDFIDVAIITVLASGVLGWFYPDIWLKSRLQGRQRRVLKSMPFVVDLLALSMEAGLDFVGAIGKVVEKSSPSPLVDEFGQLLKEIKVGASRQEALREMALRIDMMEMNSFVSILISADQMGASIGKILRQQSEQIRSERMLKAEKEGAKAAQKILIPLVFIILPAVGLMIFGPFLLSFIYPTGS
ncbi:MAG TPA: type II secretion system F family protein [Bdellovibrionota bacterium]|nr:type II secretion system F family protein [Bdellovibrionota bacterium]